MIKYDTEGKYAYFENLKFTRDDKTGYYLNSTNRKRLHRYIWEHYNGKIPEKHHIHHKDGNKQNNDISNLQLMSNTEHTSLHGIEMASEHYEKMVDNLNNNARPKATEWHKSTEGREWHKKHFEKNRDKFLKKDKLKCIYCGKEFHGVKNKDKFCGNKCKSAWRRKEKVDDENRKCQNCGKIFRTNKYSDTKCCSRECGIKIRKNKKN